MAWHIAETTTAAAARDSVGQERDRDREIERERRNKLSSSAALEQIYDPDARAHIARKAAQVVSLAMTTLFWQRHLHWAYSRAAAA